MNITDRLGIYEMIDAAAEDTELRIHIVGESQGWVSGIIDTELTDETILFLRVGAGCSDANFRILIESIDAVRY